MGNKQATHMWVAQTPTGAGDGSLSVGVANAGDAVGRRRGKVALPSFVNNDNSSEMREIGSSRHLAQDTGLPYIAQPMMLNGE